MSRVQARIAGAVFGGTGLPAGRVAPVLRAQADAASVAAVLAGAVPPDGVGPVPVAPARGPVRVVQDWAVLPGGTRRRDGAHLQAMGPVAVMVAEAARRHAARGGDAAFVAPFDDRQVAVAERYAALVERFAAGGMKCASVEARGGGGGGVGVSEALLAVGAEIERLRAAAGRVVVLDGRAHMDRGVRRSVVAVVLVHAVCVGGDTLTDVLRGHGWAKKTDNLRVLRTGLAAALGRMSEVAGA